eukprot:m.1366121 g.1366121  ORF g.1366121 m.1366121 type:complete len:579 (+) comp24951_c0_seq7:127-1863(+)
MRQYFLLHGGSPLNLPQQYSCDGQCIESTPVHFCPGKTGFAAKLGAILCFFFMISVIALLNLPNSTSTEYPWNEHTKSTAYTRSFQAIESGRILNAQASSATSSHCTIPCNSHIILHEKSSADIGTAFNRSGPPLHLADVILVPDSPAAACRGVVTDACTHSAVGILNVKVFEFDEQGAKFVGSAFQRQKREQLSWYRKLTGGVAAWTCSWRADGKEVYQSQAQTPEVDTHSHSLAIQCPVPTQILLGARSPCGHLTASLSFRVTNAVTQEIMFSLSDMPVCAASVTKPNLPAATTSKEFKHDDIFGDQFSEYLGACTMVTELDPMFDTAALTLLWTEYMLANDVDSVLVYVDANQRDGPGLPALEVDIATKLSHHIQSGRVELVLFHLSGRGWLETQQMMETHCIWRYRNRAKWIIHDDIDEFMQPLMQTASGQSALLVDVVKHLEDKFSSAAAFQVRQSFWGHLPSEGIAKDSLALWNMTWRSSGPFKGGREKLIFQPGQVNYISVHSITGGPRPVVPDPEKHVRLNHFRRHFKGLGSEDPTPSWRDSGIGPSPVRDTSFLALWQQLALPTPSARG